MINQWASLLIMYVAQVSSRRKAASKIEKLLCIFQKFPVASFIFITHCLQVCITKLELLFSDILYFMFWAEGLAFSAKVYLNFVCSLYFRWLHNLCYQNSLLLLLPLQQLCDRGEVPTSMFCKWRTEAKRRGHAQIDNVAGTVWVVVVGSVVWSTGVGFTKSLQSSGLTEWAELSTWWIKHWRFEICSRDLYTDL